MSAAAAPDDTPTPGRFGCAIGLVRRLIEFARELAAAFQQPAVPSPATAATRFGADGIAQILARIARALLRAQVLQERLQRLAARPEPKLRPQQTPTPSNQHTPRLAAPSVVAAAPDLDQPPTAESIAAEDRRRPIGAVLADICHDLGIMPSHPLWREIARAIGLHRGNLVALFNRAMDRMFEGPGWQDAMRATFPQPSAPGAQATGPP